MEHFPIHHGIHVSLGLMQREYIPLFLPGVNDPEVIRGVILRPPITLEAELKWYESLADRRSDIVFSILLHEGEGEKKTYRYIGHTGLHGIEWPAGHATSGSIICDKTLFGKRYGTEAKMLLLYDAFYVRGLRKVCSHVKVFNGNSWGHLLACGYKLTGRRREHHFDLVEGKLVDDIQLEVFRNEWEPIWEKYCETNEVPHLSEEQKARLKKDTDS